MIFSHNSLDRESRSAGRAETANFVATFQNCIYSSLQNLKVGSILFTEMRQIRNKVVQQTGQGHTEAGGREEQRTQDSNSTITVCRFLSTQ